MYTSAGVDNCRVGGSGSNNSIFLIREEIIHVVKTNTSGGFCPEIIHPWQSMVFSDSEPSLALVMPGLAFSCTPSPAFLPTLHGHSHVAHTRAFFVFGASAGFAIAFLECLLLWTSPSESWSKY